MKDKLILNQEDMIYVEKGWGYERWIWNESYCGKILYFNKNKKCSWHIHPLKDEVLMCFSGSIVMKYSYEEDLSKAEEVVLTAGMAFHVPPGLYHQMIALEDSFIFETSTHHEESDSIRIVKGD
ncbi:MAG: cupin domain-containing protein [Neisseriaceae bacterium]|nr:MAG: cupin domain-containing protein [Neisseriaceae bacterium]